MGNWSTPAGWDIPGTNIFTLWARDDNTGQFLGQIEDFTMLNAVLPMNQVGNWSITCRADQPAIQQLLLYSQNANVPAGVWGPGVVCKRGTTTAFSGPVTSIESVGDNSGPIYTISGLTDLKHFAARVVMPTITASWTPPNQDPFLAQFFPYVTYPAPGVVGGMQVSDIIHNMMNNAITHDSSHFAPFFYSNTSGCVPGPFTIAAAPPAFGPSIRWICRYQNYLQEMGNVARTPSGTDAGQTKPVVVFDVKDLTASLWQPTLNTALFSQTWGTIASYQQISAAAQYNDAIVQGNNIVRTVVASVTSGSDTYTDSTATSDDVGRTVIANDFPQPCVINSVVGSTVTISKKATATNATESIQVVVNGAILQTETTMPDDLATWGPTEYVVSGYTNTSARDLIYQGRQQLISVRSVPSVVFIAIDTPRQQWLVDYNIGDLSTCVLPDGTQVQDFISQVSLALQSSTAPQIQVTLGAIQTHNRFGAYGGYGGFTSKYAAQNYGRPY